jgi:integrase/recombinase XerD
MRAFHASTPEMRHPPQSKAPTFQPSPSDLLVIDEWLQHLQSAKGRRPRTAEAYRLVLLRLGEFMAPKSILMVDAIELETFAGLWLHKRGVVAASRRPYISALRGFFAWARLRGKVLADPSGALMQPKTAQPLPRALSLASAEKLMWAPDLSTFKGRRDAAMLGLMIGCGLRVSGLVSLNVGDLRNTEIEGKPRVVLRTTEKGAKTREVPLPREAEMMIRVYLDDAELQALDRAVVDAKGRPDKVLFVNVRNTMVPAHDRRGEKLRLNRHSVWRLIQTYGQAAGIPADERHPHAFRHLFGVELAEDGADLLVRQGLMGHADPKSTAIYDAMTIKRKTRVIDASAPLGKIKSPVSELLRRL